MIADCRLFQFSNRQLAIDNQQSFLSYRFNLQSRVTLPMSLGALIMLAPLFLEHDDLWGATVIHNRGCNFGPINQRIAKSRFFIVRGGQRFEVDRGPDFLFEQRDAYGRTRFHPKLLSASSNNCRSHYLPTYQSSPLT